ncbi:hypothetical protein CSAL01_13267 [Colletotrichum salicis]|uniref:Uncharacterized protein n=1 Tax=Colletotrichum salicis TaxID=1209931 RepID=A0A135UXA1_9PEZI|nr:hypothetical protein CSAL01_13267 [Colletotrichum salicis]
MLLDVCEGAGESFLETGADFSSRNLSYSMRALVRIELKTNEGQQSLVWGWCRMARSGPQRNAPRRSCSVHLMVRGCTHPATQARQVKPTVYTAQRCATFIIRPTDTVGLLRNHSHLTVLEGSEASEPLRRFPAVKVGEAIVIGQASVSITMSAPIRKKRPVRDGRDEYPYPAGFRNGQARLDSGDLCYRLTKDAL